MGMMGENTVLVVNPAVFDKLAVDLQELCQKLVTE
jgi:hypothetical protein